MSERAGSPTGLAFERFRVGDREEWLMRLGRPHTPAILFVPPLFEEMNRTRALIVAVMHRLAKRGHSCWLVDLGGTGESERELGEVTWRDWRHDVTSAAAHVAAAALMETGIADGPSGRNTTAARRREAIGTESITP